MAKATSKATANAKTTAGPSTALLTKCVSNFAQDDKRVRMARVEMRKWGWLVELAAKGNVCCCG